MCVVRSCFRFPPEPFSSRFYSIFPLFPIRSSRFCPFPFLRFVFICPFCSCVEFYRKRSFISLPENYRLFPLLPPCPPLSSYSRSASFRSVSPFLSVLFPSCFPFPPSLCELFVFGGDLPTLPERNPPCPSSCPDRFRPVWLFGSAAPFCSPSFVLPSASRFRCPLVLLLPSASTPLSPGLSVFSP